MAERESVASTMVAVIRSVWIHHRDMSAPAILALSWDQIIHVMVRLEIKYLFYLNKFHFLKRRGWDHILDPYP